MRIVQFDPVEAGLTRANRADANTAGSVAASPGPRYVGVGNPCENPDATTQFSRRSGPFSSSDSLSASNPARTHDSSLLGICRNSRWRGVTCKKRSKYFCAGGRPMLKKSMICMKSLVSPLLARRTHSVRRSRPGRYRSWLMRARSARDIAHARGLDNECRGAATRKALVPSEHRRRDIAVFGRAPRNHGRNPGARRQSDRTQRDRLEQLRLLGLNRGGPGRIQRRVFDTLRRTPRRHGLRRRESQPLPRFPPMRSLRPAPVLPQPTWRGSSCP